MSEINDKIEQAIWLRREGNCAVVLVETASGWVEVIRESLAGWPEVTFSHIVESKTTSRPDKEAAA